MDQLVAARSLAYTIRVDALVTMGGVGRHMNNDSDW
jgi:hypothetical protein